MIDAMLQTILLVAIILVAISLTAVVLLQRSEGGALGMGGGPSGFMTARGAGNLLTTVTWWLAGVLFALIIILTIVSNMARDNSVIDADAVGSIALDSQPTQSAPAQTAPAQAPAQPAAPSLDDLESSLTASPSTPSQGGTPTEASRPNPAPQP